MSREIKFKGKRIDNGGWVYGFYSESTPIFEGVKHSYITPICENGSIDMRRKVIPETVGQFIGRCDKNDVKVFEGDIIKAYDGRISGPVIYDLRGLVFGIPNGPSEIYQFSFNFLETKDIEIIGNIHENPELLEATP